MTGHTIGVRTAGPLTTVQDRGRPGFAHLGVPRAGALDRPAAELAQRLVGNLPDAALLEIVMGGFAATTSSGCWVAVTGAAGSLRIGGVAGARGEPVWWAAGAELTLATPDRGMRSYLAVAGGIDVEPVLGSRSTDTLAWVGPPVVRDGGRIPVGEATASPQPIDVPPAARRGPLRVTPGPRADWFAPVAWRALTRSSYVVTTASNRIGLRLDGPELPRARSGELASEGMVLGAVQVPPDGRPVVFLADHPPTGGYPVIGVVRTEDLWQCAQVRPGDEVRFTPDRVGARR
ncbi:MAG: 5-oxoprolinase subunit C family protein [Nocardioides sp.]